MEQVVGFEPTPSAWKAEMLAADTIPAYKLHFIIRDAELDNVNDNNFTYLSLVCTSLLFRNNTYWCKGLQNTPN